MWTPQPDFVEQSSDDIWKATCLATKACLLLCFKDVVDFHRYFLRLSFVLILLGLVVPDVYSAEKTVVYKDDEKIERSGGKRSKEEIKNMVQQIRARREAGPRSA